MKQINNSISIFIVLISTLFISCARGPSDSEILELMKERYKYSNLLLEIKIEKRGKSRKLYEKRVYPVTVRCRYIRKGLGYGYSDGIYDNDIEHKRLSEYLLGKNQWDKWEIEDSRTLEDREVRKYWRPESQSMEEFYKDKIKK